MGTTWATGAWAADAWGANTWADAVEVSDAPAEVTFVVPALSRTFTVADPE
jgi:hypothetical protein